MDNIFFVKFIGYFMFITGSALMLSKESRMSLLENMKHNDSFLILLGYLNLLIGIPIVILHNIWEFSVLGLVTIIGWMMVIKGFVFFAKPSLVKKKDITEKNIKIRICIAAFIGLGFMYCGYYPYW